MLTKSNILDAVVYHKRHIPVVYKFAHKVIFLLLNLNKIEFLPKTKFFSINRFNIFSLFWKNYGFNNFEDPKCNITRVLTEFKLDAKRVNEILLLTMPKVLGYVFNPVSFWLCFDKQGFLYVVLAEVNNTFGARHAYLCYNKDGSHIESTSYLHKNKIFHVSPFCEINGHYEFRFNISEHIINIDVNYCNEIQPIITTSIVAARKPFNDLNFMKYFFIYPFMTIKVILLIHWHALRLWIKKVACYKKPNKPSINIS